MTVTVVQKTMGGSNSKAHNIVPDKNSEAALGSFGEEGTLPRSLWRKCGVSVANLPREIFKLIFVVITFLSYCVVAPVFFLFMIPLYAYRCIVIYLQKLFKPKWINIMSSRDALVGLDNTTQRCDCMFLATMVFRGVPDIRQIQAHFYENVMEKGNGELYKKLTFYYENWLGVPFWKPEEKFQVEDHLRLFDYNINMKKVIGRNGEEGEFVTEDEILRCFSEIEKLPFPKRQSPWEIMVLPNVIPREGDLHKPYVYVIPEVTVTTADGRTENRGGSKEGNVQNEKYFSLVFRVHHAIGDATSFLRMLMTGICGELAVDDVSPATSSVSSKTNPKVGEKGGMGRMGRFVKVLRTLVIIILSPYYHFKQFFVEIDTSIWHLSSKRLSKKNHFVSTERIPVESLRQVGKAYKVTLTGVFLAGLAGGVHNFLKLTGKGHLISKFMRALSPMSWQNRPTHEGMVNHWTAGVFAIPVGEKTPEKRLKACKKSIENVVDSPILLVNFLSVPLLLSVPNFLTDIWGVNWMASMIMSKFPGPKQPVKSFGKHSLDNMITFVPHMRGSAGLGVMFPTCLGNVRCTVSVDTSILKDYSDAQLLVGLIDEEFRILRSLYNPQADYHV